MSSRGEAGENSGKAQIGDGDVAVCACGFVSTSLSDAATATAGGGGGGDMDEGKAMSYAAAAPFGGGILLIKGVAGLGAKVTRIQSTMQIAAIDRVKRLPN
jgi:hypothetical protein